MKNYLDTVTIVVPVHRLDMALIKCVESLGNLDPSPKEILIVLDGISTSIFLEYVPEINKNVRVLSSRERLGAAAARNLGAKQTNNALLLFIDSDVSVPEDLVRHVVDHFTHDKKVDALFGSYDDEPGQSNFFSQFKNLMHYFVHQMAMERATTFWGACGAVKNDAYKRAQGFDESLEWLEDVDLGIRLWQKGANIKLVKSIQVKHWKRWTLFSLLTSDVFHRAIPWASLAFKYQHLQNDLNTDANSRLSALLVVSFLVIITFWTVKDVAYISMSIILVLLWLNRIFYLFLLRKRGLFFLFPSILWHWFYFLYSSIAFSAGIILAFLKAPRPQKGL